LPGGNRGRGPRALGRLGYSARLAPRRLLEWPATVSSLDWSGAEICRRSARGQTAWAGPPTAFGREGPPVDARCRSAPARVCPYLGRIAVLRGLAQGCSGPGVARWLRVWYVRIGSKSGGPCCGAANPRWASCRGRARFDSVICAPGGPYGPSWGPRPMRKSSIATLQAVDLSHFLTPVAILCITVFCRELQESW
jgi:hypothetical protein